MTLELTNPPGPYHVTPDQHRPEDAPMGFRGVGHYDTGTAIKLCQSPRNGEWCASTDTMACIEPTEDAAIRRLADMAAEGLRKASEPRHIAHYAAALEAAHTLTGYTPRSIARRGKR